jgi:actin-like ATPase involved in cell morphogenesis
VNSTSLVRYLADTHNLLIGEQTAVAAIDKLTSIPPTAQDRVEYMTIRGRNRITGFPNGVEITRFELRKVLSLPQATDESDFIGGSQES